MHKKKCYTWIVLSFLIFTGMFIVFNAETTNAEENKLYVDINVIYTENADGSLEHPYKSIQSAIDAASNGDVIQVLPGEYNGDLVIDKSITMRCDEKENTWIMSGSKANHLIRVTADSVSIENFTIDDSSTNPLRKSVIYINAANVRVINCHVNHSDVAYCIHVEDGYNAIIKNNLFNNSKGVKFSDSGSCTFYENVMTNHTGETCLKMISSNHNSIEKNIFEDAKYGIYFDDVDDTYIINNSITNISDYGIYLTSGENVSIINNSIIDNTNYGIGSRASDGIIFNNEFVNNSIAIRVDSFGNTISNNTFVEDRSYDIFMGSSSSKNLLYNNYFYDEPAQNHVMEYGSNYWNNSDGVGNYWNDFYGPDPSNTNHTLPLTDEAYIYRKGGARDYHPLGVFEEPPIISEPSPSHLSSGESRDPVLRVRVTDPEDERLDVYFYYLVGNEEKLINSQPINVASGETASVTINSVYSYIGLGYDFLCLWKVRVEDSYNYVYSNSSANDSYVFSTMQTPGNNEPPVADVGGPYDEVQYVPGSGALVEFNGSRCDDYDGQIEFYRWSFGDGETVTNVISPIHVYQRPDDYNVNLVVIDNNGASTNASTVISVVEDANDPPEAYIQGPDSAVAGKNIEFTSYGTVDADNDELRYVWDMGDGSIKTDSTFKYKYKKAGSYTVTLKVYDTSDESDEATHTIVIKEPKGEDTPGFELIIFVISMIGILYWKKKR